MSNATKQTHFAAKDFSIKVRNALSRAGIQIIGTTNIPGDGPMGYANGSRGYELSDNGCMRIRTRSEIIAWMTAIDPRLVSEK